MSQEQHYNMDEQHFPPIPKTSESDRVDLLSNMSGQPGGNQIRYSAIQPTTHMGSSRDYLPHFQQDGYDRENMTSMMANIRRYSDSMQRPSQQHGQSMTSYTYDAPGSYRDMGDNIHLNPDPASGHDSITTQRYPLSANTYSSEIAYGHNVPAVQSSLAEMQLPDPTVVDYRQSMSSYHRRESESLQQQQQEQRSHTLRQLLSHDTHSQDHTQPHNLFTQGSPMVAINSRRDSGIPELHPDERIHHGQRILPPLGYDISPNIQSARHLSNSGSNSGDLHGRADASGLMQLSDDSYSTSHASSSIPMSNSHPRHLYASDAISQQQQHQSRDNPIHNLQTHALSPDPKRHESQHQSRMTQPQNAPYSERQKLHLQQQHHYDHSHGRRRSQDMDVNTQHTGQRVESPYRSRGDNAMAPVELRNIHTTSEPNIRMLERPHSNPRTHSLPQQPTTSYMLRPSSGLQFKSISPMSTSDNESTAGSESNNQEEDERNNELSRRGGKRRDSSGVGMGQEETLGVGQGQDGGGEEVSAPVKKRKKSKMHECEVCAKKFPRPSGLKTHMNTHSNEKPFPCGFPGCARTFGVRSNAKRHLRTHGVVPSATGSATGETPYVVDFSTPMILPPHQSNIPLLTAGTGRAGSDRRQQSNLTDDASSEDMGEGSSIQDHLLNGKRPPSAFKLRWMPLSLTSRTNAMALRPAQDTGSQRAESREPDVRWGLEGDRWEKDQDGPPDRGDRVSDTEDDFGREQADSYGDSAMVAHLSTPLKPVIPSTPSTVPAVDGGNLPIVRARGSSLVCACNPPCPQGSEGITRCRKAGLASNAVLPPGVQSTQTSPSLSVSISPSRSTIYANRTTSVFDEERNSHAAAGSHPYHSSQRHKQKK